MAARVRTMAAAFVAICAFFSAGVAAQQPDRRDDAVRAMLDRSRLLEDVAFEIPVGLYRRYLRQLREPVALPVSHIAESATYHLTVDKGRTLRVELCLRVFDPAKCRNLPVLSADRAWEDLSVNGKQVNLAIKEGWFRFTPAAAGLYTLTARAKTDESDSSRLASTGLLASASRSHGGTLRLGIWATVRTFVVFDSPGAWQVRSDSDGWPLSGTKEAGTHGRIALTPRRRISIEYRRPVPRRERRPRYRLSGDVAWNLDAGVQQVTASLKATIAGGASDSIELLLPGAAERVSVTGPEVRHVRLARGRVTVHLRGKILGATVLRVSYELPPGAGSERKLGRLGVADGHWAGGTLVVTNTAGGSEILPETMTGLREMALADVPPSARANLAGPAVLAYEITSRSFSAAVEVLHLGEFALRESIADLAHYELFVARDGSIISRVLYEIRNRNKQFLRLELPAGARVLLARVNEKSRPISPVPGRKNAWLLPLERSSASVMGLVSFPVEVVFVCKIAPLEQGRSAEIPLPAIDLPIAYGWCETYLPPELSIEKWSGVTRRVDRFTSETATASLEYGRSELAAGYAEKSRPKVPPTPPLVGMAFTAVAPDLPKPPRRPEAPAIALVAEATPSPVTQPVRLADRGGGGSGGRGEIDSRLLLSRNYWRAGKDAYAKGQYAAASRYLNKTGELAPGSVEAANARRLLSNIKMLSGDVKVKGQAQKAAAQVVHREVKESNILLVGGQMAYIGKGLKAAREGKTGEARKLLEAAEALNAPLLERHADVKALKARMREADKQLAEFRRQDRARAKKLRKRISQLKSKGEYSKALGVAMQLRRTAGDSGADEMSKEMVDLAVASARRELTIRRRVVRGEDAAGAVTRVYDVRDLVTRAEKFQRSGAPSGSTERITGLIRGNIDPQSWNTPGNEILELGGQLVITQSAPNQEHVARLLGKLRQVRGPQVEQGSNIAGQRAKGVLKAPTAGYVTDYSAEVVQPGATAPRLTFYNGGRRVTVTGEITRYKSNHLAVDSHVPGADYGDLVEDWERGKEIFRKKDDGAFSYRPGGKRTRVTLADKELADFIERNYAWSLEHGKAKPGYIDRTITVPTGGTLLVGGQRVSVSELAEKLRFNLGQKVVFNSTNVNADARAARALGVNFIRGNNDVVYAVIDEAQFRSLMELDAANTSRYGRAVAPNARMQETIVGTDALLANEWIANPSFAGDRANYLYIGGNDIPLAHDSYLLIDNGRFLTAVRTSPMQDWRETPADVEFVQVPQNIEVPRVGQLVRSEKTLLEPSDRMIIRAEYTWKGALR